MKMLYALRYTLYAIGISFLLSGCVVRTYPLTKERIDQDLTTGNRGYLMRGQPSRTPEKERKATRTTQVVEIEIHSPIKFEKMPKTKPQETAPVQRVEQPIEGNRGYITQSITPEIAQPATESSYEKYTVQKGDTLQKISKKFYGTSKKWTNLFDANKDTLKGPNKVYPGQVLRIPLKETKQPKENLK